MKIKKAIVLVLCILGILYFEGCMQKRNIPVSREGSLYHDTESESLCEAGTDNGDDTDPSMNGGKDKLPAGNAEDSLANAAASDVNSGNGDGGVNSGNDEGLKTENTDNCDEDKGGSNGFAGAGEVFYVSASKLNVREAPSVRAKKIDTLVRGNAVRSVEERKDSRGHLWEKILYICEGREVTGWVSAQFLVKNRKDLLPEPFKNLDYLPQRKVAEYPQNPRVKVKGIYVSLVSAAGTRIDELIEMAEKTDINALVIDVKGDGGEMLFPTKAAAKYCPRANEKARLEDVESLIQKLRENNIYAIARIVTFKDPLYSATYPDRAIVYKDSGKLYKTRDGISWASPHDRQLWEYNVEVAIEAALAGFNEIQFDYVRFPASGGGKLDKILDYRNKRDESKAKAIQEFLKYAYQKLSPYGVYVAADVYGLVGSAADDMGIGQYWEAISNVVDYICPMMYPSHYAPGTYGLDIPDAHPYETISGCAEDSIRRNMNIETPAIIRPWLQDFTATWVRGHIKYTEKEVRAQIKALKDKGIDEFMLWNAANVYTESALVDIE